MEVKGCCLDVVGTSLALAPVACVGNGDWTLLLGVVGVVAVRLMATGYSGRGKLTVCNVNLAKLAGAARGVGRTLKRERGFRLERGRLLNLNESNSHDIRMHVGQIVVVVALLLLP